MRPGHLLAGWPLGGSLSVCMFGWLTAGRLAWRLTSYSAISGTESYMWRVMMWQPRLCAGSVSVRCALASRRARRAGGVGKWSRARKLVWAMYAA